jgi:toxin YoeB
MKVYFTPRALAEYQYFEQKQRKLARRIQTLCEDIKKTPFTGLGKPEPLRHTLSGYWSRRIDQTHRLVYRIEDDKIVIYKCRSHYHDK